MPEIFRHAYLVLGAQVGLADAGDDDAWPLDWPSNDELFISEGRGVAVATANNVEVEVVVTTADDADRAYPGEWVGSTAMVVGSQGLSVGTGPGELNELAWPRGITAVEIYSESRPGAPAQITFVLTHDAGTVRPVAARPTTVAEG
jgi:hypothetical protein